MPERFATVNGGIELCYETFGEYDAPPLLLVMGLGAQMIHWDLEFCALLASHNFFVIRFDNRDCGRSSRVASGAPLKLRAALAGDRSAAAYGLDDMAEDAAGLLDALGLDAAHVVGVSMGGMIAQTLAIAHPERVLSLCSIMSTTGERSVGWPHAEIAWVLTESRPSDREGVAAHHLRIWQALSSPGYQLDEERIMQRGRETFDRGISAAGYLRQLSAITTQSDRSGALGSLQLPALVIHGCADLLIDVSGGVATARAIPGARLELLEGMGHDLPRALWDPIASLIAETAR